MRALTIVFALGLSLIGAASAFAAPGGAGPAQPSTEVYHNLTDVITGVLPCAEVNYTIEIHYQAAVVHSTSLSEDTFVGSFLERATFTATPDDSTLPSFSGSFTFHAVLSNLKVEPGATSVIGAQTIRATGSDGSSLLFHEVTHAVFSEEGELLSGFEKLFCK